MTRRYGREGARPGRILRGLLAAGRGIPRPHMLVLDQSGTALGEVTSGTFSPTLKKGIALALLDATVKEGDEVPSTSAAGRSRSRGQAALRHRPRPLG